MLTILFRTLYSKAKYDDTVIFICLNYLQQTGIICKANTFGTTASDTLAWT